MGRNHHSFDPSSKEFATISPYNDAYGSLKQKKFIRNSSKWKRSAKMVRMTATNNSQQLINAVLPLKVGNSAVLKSFSRSKKPFGNKFKYNSAFSNKQNNQTGFNECVKDVDIINLSQEDIVIADFQKQASASKLPRTFQDLEKSKITDQPLTTDTLVISPDTEEQKLDFASRQQATSSVLQQNEEAKLDQPKTEDGSGLVSAEDEHSIHEAQLFQTKIEESSEVVSAEDAHSIQFLSTNLQKQEG